MKKRLPYAVAALLLFLIELFIALFVHDTFVRPYFGDVLVVILLWCIIKTVFPADRVWLTPAIFLFACLVELSQIIPLVDLLGLGDVPILATIMGRSFSLPDILCYGCGCLLIFGLESLARIARRSDCPVFKFW